MRYAALLLIAVSLGGATASAQSTLAERLAERAAQVEVNEAPRDGNIRSYHLPTADLLKAEHLEHTRTLMEVGGTVWSIVTLVLLLQVGLVGRMQVFVGKFRNRWLQGYVFLLVFLLCTTLLGLPLSIYGQHVRRSYGLSVQTWSSWIADQAKGFCLSWIFGGLLLMLLFFVIGRAPRRWWLVFWGLSIPIALGTMLLTPYVIDPLFNHYESLNATHPDLVRRLQEVAERGHMDIPPERMFLMKASEKSTTLNAYVTGFGPSKRVVVWDTSIAKGTPDQVLFIFGHESGHYVLHHIAWGLAEALLGLLLLFYIAFQVLHPLLARYGARWGVRQQTDWGAAAVLLLILTVLGVVSQPVAEARSRSREHDADVYGQEAIHGLVPNPQDTAQSTFQLLGEASFDDPNPSPAVVLWTYSHPAVGWRAAFGAHYNPWEPGLKPKYFPQHQ